MLDEATEFVAKAADPSVRSRIKFEQQSVSDFKSPTPIDLFYSNAALHWLPNHERLFPNLIQQVRPGGYFSVQMPNNFKEPSHVLMYQSIRDMGWSGYGPIQAALQTRPSIPDNPMQFYYSILLPYADSIDVWETNYLQPLNSKPLSPTVYHPVLEFTKGSALSPLLTALPTQDDRNRLQRHYSELLEKAYPISRVDKDTVFALFPFKRVFIVARRK